MRSTSAAAQHIIVAHPGIHTPLPKVLPGAQSPPAETGQGALCPESTPQQLLFAVHFGVLTQAVVSLPVPVPHVPLTCSVIRLQSRYSIKATSHATGSMNFSCACTPEGGQTWFQLIQPFLTYVCLLHCDSKLGPISWRWLKMF